LFFSATMPDPIVVLTRELLHNPATINLERKSAPAVGITQAIYPVAQELKSSLLAALLERGTMKEALVFTRTKHRANRLWEFLEKRGVSVARIHGNRSQAQRTDALEGFKSGRYRVLVATDIAARGIDVEALGHGVNFDVPAAPEDYIHRVGRTARAELTGEAYTFVAPEETADLKAIERAIGKPLPRVTLPDFDYSAQPTTKLEVPLKERLAKLRAQRSEERSRAKAKQDRRTTGASGGGGGGTPSAAASGSQGGAKSRDDGGSRRRRRRRGPGGSSGSSGSSGAGGSGRPGGRDRGPYAE
jgi:ATP-dependent RNA helicase RhlE